MVVEGFPIGQEMDSVPMIRWATSMLPGELNDWPAVRAHHERMLADAGVERAMRDEGLIET